jgi:hypothetical protein
VACSVDGVPQSDQLGVLQRPDVEEGELLLDGLAEGRDAGADGAGSDEEMKLVDQAVDQQVVPGGEASEADDVATVAGLQFGDPGMCVLRRTISVLPFQGAVSSGPAL